ncbi:hydroxyethylthiazole kinase [Paraburkholderia denitrificans]|uniref:Hydroxyethylthiazole kinase n=1 Tax=Paraburkholderia denitrificans TaxID=694025 RepID=A0ABW0JCQ6_9BURK
MLPSILFSVVDDVRRRAPLVHCLANLVTTNMTANVLLAAGASPAMVVAREEVAEFVTLANALSVNLGTLDAAQAEAIQVAVEAGRAAGVPWVLDPVAVGALTFRTDFARKLIAAQPAVIRGNASEIIGLAGGPASGRGVDSTASTDDARGAARALALDLHAVVAVTGAIDYITDGKRSIELANGDEVMPRVTGTGCALSALVAAFIGAGGYEGNLWIPAVAAVALAGVAGELAARETAGPGSFTPAWLDRLATLDAGTFASTLHYRECR